MKHYEMNKIKDIIKNAANAVLINEKLPIGVMAVKAKRVAEAYPHDSTSVGMYRFLAKRAQNRDSLFISRGELRDVYNKLFTVNTKFSSFFKEELGLKEHQLNSEMKRSPHEGMVIDMFDKSFDNSFNMDSFEALSEDLSSVLDKNNIKKYTSKIAKVARKICAKELNSIGFLPKKIDIVAGQEDVLIGQAIYDTPKGKVSLLIPIEIKKGMVLSPTKFLGKMGFVEITDTNVKDFILSSAGKKFSVNVQDLLKKISNVKNSSLNELSDVEQIVKKAALKKGTSIVDPNSIFLNEIDPVSPELRLPEIESPAEVQSIANYLNSQFGLAEFTLGRNAIDLGRNLLELELKSMGAPKAQIIISSSTKDSITFGVTINNKYGFKAPIKFVNSKPVLPKVVIANGNIYEFNVNGINHLISNEDTDAKVLAKTSPLYSVKPSQLVEQIRKAVEENNYTSAADALHVLKHSEDTVAYNAGYAIYVAGLKGEYKESQSVCSAPVKLGSSQKLVCSHTGLTIDKVYQDQYGNCRPLYRKGMVDSKEAVSMITSRIYFE